jgi:hypothetical protein
MTDRRFRKATFPMSIEDKDELAQEFAEFGYRETFDPNDADRRNFYKVEKWDAAELHIEALIHAPTTWNVQERSSPAKRTADRAVAIRYAKASAS